jgi:hypothetical protein
MKERLIFLVVSVTFVAFLLGCWMGRSFPKANNSGRIQERPLNVSVRNSSTTTNQVNLAAVTNALCLVDQLVQVRCFRMVQKYSLSKSGEGLLKDYDFDKRLLKENILGLEGIINISELDHDKLDMLREQFEQELKLIEEMTSQPHSFEERLSKMSADEALLYYYLLTNYKALMLAQMKDAVITKMESQNQGLKELVLKINF